MTYNQYTPDATIRRQVEVLISKLDNRLAVDIDAPVQRDEIFCYVPCLYRLDYVRVPPIKCCACGRPVAPPIEYRRFGYPVCTADCAREPERPWDTE